jgi:repressor LexA
MNPLTERQKLVLNAIAKLTSVNGYAPTFRELMDDTGIKSPNGITLHLKALERKGYVTREPGKSRTLRLTPTTP